MELVDERDARIVVALTPEEFRLLAGCVNEKIEAVEDWEFSTRLGAEKDDARRMRVELRELATRLRPAE
jgi:hypothetical protein